MRILGRLIKGSNSIKKEIGSCLKLGVYWGCPGKDCILSVGNFALESRGGEFG